MATLVYTALTSLDGYVEDASGRFDWARPDEEVHGFVNELERATGTHLLGRRMLRDDGSWETVLDGPYHIRESPGLTVPGTVKTLHGA